MCGVIGLQQKVADLDLLRRLFDNTQIRGRHATGVSYKKYGKIHTVKEPVAVEEFFNLHDPQEWINEEGGLTLIGHIRYSTSDLRYNQPFQNENVAIAHNGVITQEPKETWEYDTETGNDSELILHAINDGGLFNPLEKYADRSMAVVCLSRWSELHFFRNHKRPLWYSETGNEIVVTSTKDIAIRSGIRHTIHKCEPFKLYSAIGGKVEGEAISPDFEYEDMQYG